MGRLSTNAVQLNGGPYRPYSADISHRHKNLWHNTTLYAILPCMDTTNMKRCPKCGIAKPLALFYHYSASPDGYQAYCRQCGDAATKKRAKKIQEKKRQMWIFKTEKRCSRCGKTLLLSAFRKRKPIGYDESAPHRRPRRLLSSWCKKCEVIYNKEYRGVLPLRVRAREYIATRVRRGKIVKPSACEMCGGSSSRIEAHHPDYLKKHIVLWLCSRCHHCLHSLYRVIQRKSHTSDSGPTALCPKL